MTEKKGVPVPYVTTIIGAILSLAGAGVIWLVSTTSDVPLLREKIMKLERQTDDHEDRIRSLERRSFFIPEG